MCRILELVLKIKDELLKSRHAEVLRITHLYTQTAMEETPAVQPPTRKNTTVRAPTVGRSDCARLAQMKVARTSTELAQQTPPPPPRQMMTSRQRFMISAPFPHLPFQRYGTPMYSERAFERSCTRERTSFVLHKQTPWRSQLSLNLR